MSDKIKNVLDDYSSETKKIFGKKLKKIILFGSYARGDYDLESDIDIMILVDMTDDEVRQKNKVFCEFNVDLDIENNIFLSPIIINYDHFYKWLPVYPFYKNVINEGVILYE